MVEDNVTNREAIDADIAELDLSAGTALLSLVPLEEGPPANVFIFPLAQPTLFPGMIMPLSITSERGQRIVDQVANQNQYLGFVARRDEPSETIVAAEALPDQLHTTGVAARLVRSLKMPDGSYGVLVQAVARFRLERWVRKTPFLIANVTYPEETYGDPTLTDALVREVQSTTQQLLSLIPNAPEGLDIASLNIEDAPRLTDFVAAHLGMPAAQKQQVLETNDVTARLRLVLEFLVRELGVRQLGARIHEEIREHVEEQQKKYVLREQLKAIRRELGEEVDEREADRESYEKRIAEAGMTPEGEERARAELRRLTTLTPEAAEYNMIRTYLDWLTELPWSKLSKDNVDMAHARAVLERDHYGLAEIKDRIEEILAVRKLRPTMKGPILCFVGPPGVGKTSLGQSIARALGRKFYRFSLGGMRDEAEIKGHRRTYIGAMPGKVLQGIKRAGTRNPVFMLDEIDKLASDWRGDPASALLEVLDPAQNVGFLDHYLDVPFDLSQILFIATANVLETIPAPLLDRMEVIRLSSYIEEEKVEIAARYLLPRQREENGITATEVQVPRPVLAEVINGWTREGGVRNLEREVARICRKTASAVAKGVPLSPRVTTARLPDLLGPRRFESEVVSRPLRKGMATGLAWTPHGGEILFIECGRMKGSGHLILTGQLGDVMSESGRIALSYVRSLAEELGFADEDLGHGDIHVHFPSGAIPKDGPSAGITIASALVTLLAPDAVLKPRLAMTGEITLTGKVLPVGGIKEKVIGARRAGVTELIMPSANRKDLAEIPKRVQEGLIVHFVDDYRDVLKAAFVADPSKQNGRKTKSPNKKKGDE